MILESIFRGNFTPLDLVVPDDPDYKKLNLKVCEPRDQLTEKLSPEDNSLLDTMVHHIYTAELMECEAYFTFGFSAGMVLQKEAMEKLKSVIRD